MFAGVSASGSAHLLSHDSLENAVGQLVQQTASLEALVSALESEQQQTLQEVYVNVQYSIMLF